MHKPFNPITVHAYSCSFIVKSAIIAALSSTALSQKRPYVKELEQRGPLKAAFSVNFENVKKHPVPMSALKWQNADNVVHTHTHSVTTAYTHAFTHHHHMQIYAHFTLLRSYTHTPPTNLLMQVVVPPSFCSLAPAS